MRKLVGKIVKVDKHFITFQVLSEESLVDITEETEFEEENVVVLELSKHRIVARKV